MKTLDEFQAKLDLINENTTASATAAGHVAQTLTDLKAELDQALTDAGLPADQEAAILAKLTAAADTTTALRTFLEATAAGPSEPTPVPTPEPTPTPSPVE